jgi:hypothetical protein
MIEDRALTGDVRFNTDTHRMEIYDGNRWVVCDRAGERNVDEYIKEFPVRNVDEYINEKVKENALDELFGVN